MAHEKYPDRNAEIRRRVAAGEAMAAVGRDMGLTRARIDQIVKQRSRKTVWGYGCPYPAVKAWMTENKITWERFGALANVHYATLRYALAGHSNPTKRVIDAILAVTGLSYEQAFAPEVS